ncbi:MAG: type II CAAX endopeptidase family protein [Gaiellaceae bacterium]
MSGEAARSDGRLFAWAGLVGVTIVLVFIVRQGVGLPEDFRYSYWTVLVGVVSNAITLGVVVLIAGRGNVREMLALRRPRSWWRAALIGVLVIVGTGLLLVLLPFLQTSEEQGLEVAWDPDRALPFVLNAAIAALVSPIVEELTFRGLGFTLLERFGQGRAIALTGLAFALTHGLLLPLISIAAFGFGLAYLRSRTRSVYPGILIHTLVNLASSAP